MIGLLRILNYKEIKINVSKASKVVMLNKE